VSRLQQVTTTLAFSRDTHTRLVADVLATKLGRPLSTWGSANLIKEGEARMKYLEAIKAADNGDIQLLLKFARS
jgi:hypothetical protein